MESIPFITVGIVVGVLIGWLLAKARGHVQASTEREGAFRKISQLEQELATHRATASVQLQTAKENTTELQQRIVVLQNSEATISSSLSAANDHLSRAEANLDAANQTIIGKSRDLELLKVEAKNLLLDLNRSNAQLATLRANNEALNEKLATQKRDMEELGKKFNSEFENMANRILEAKTEKFTELNNSNLKAILEPLGKHIGEFKTQVEEIYNKESKERFSLGEKVKELATLNQQISEEARNLTKALKGEAKTQGRWGEMILENILERSGLQKDREYFMEHQLLDCDGKALKSDAEDKRMRPDAVIKYPDNRNVIIDSKVSLNAFSRMMNATDTDEQQQELKAHVEAVRNHIVALSAKGYDDYDKALDFVMMFVPNEPAYMAALQGDPELWNFAYDRRILLQSPTNLITSLKLIVDLWKREYQNRNSLEIADRGAKLYNKFVGFVDNLKKVGDSLNKAHQNYDEAYKQLTIGNDNLVLQATKLKNLGLKTKKELSAEMVQNSSVNELAE